MYCKQRYRTGPVGVLAEDAGTKVTVTGNAAGTGHYGVEATTGAEVTVGGYAASISGDGVRADAGAEVNVAGTATGGSNGVYASASAEVNVGGNATDGINGVYAGGAGTKVTVDGKVSGMYYIQIGATFKTITDCAPTSTKPSYREYTNGTAIVWVKGTVTFNSPAVQTVAAGGVATFNYTASGLDIIVDTDIQWYSTSAGTGTPISEPAGIYWNINKVQSNIQIMTNHNGGTPPAGTYYFRGLFDGVQSSNVATLTVDPAIFVPVTDITGVATTGAFDGITPVTLSGTVAPADASNQTIVWSLGTDSTAVGATVSGGQASATGAGTVVVTATITNGAGVSTDHTQNFTINFFDAPLYHPDDIATINDMIDHNGLGWTQYTDASCCTAPPADWTGVTWDGAATNRRITHLDVSSESLTGTLNLRYLTNLTELRCDGNNISVLDVSALTNLTELWYGNNNISTLDVSGLTNLTRLGCADNFLTSLVLNGSATYTYIDVRNNLMTAESNVSGSTVPAGKWDNGIDDFYFSPQKPPTTAPTITSANSATVAAGGTFAVTATGTAPIAYSLTGAPVGVTINPATGLITVATTTAAGAHTFTITAANGTPPNAMQSFTLTVTATVTPPVTPTTYNVSIGSFAGGSVTSNHTSAAAGATVTLTVSPSVGYELDEIKAFRTSSPTTAVALSGTGLSRTFTMPAYNVTVEAAFKKTAAQTLWEKALAVIEAAVYEAPQSVAERGWPTTSTACWHPQASRSPLR